VAQLQVAAQVLTQTFFEMQKKATPPLYSHSRDQGLSNEPSGAPAGVFLEAHQV
jgi:hypothetical protein